MTRVGGGFIFTTVASEDRRSAKFQSIGKFTHLAPEAP
jgi:hypothetical protein